MTSPTVRLDTFELPLARFILCGGEGLAGACGRLKMDDDPQAAWITWSVDSMAVRFVETEYSEDGVARRQRDIGPLERPARWSLPLDPASPWPSRLAIVATWMLGWRPVCGASVVLGERGVNLGACTLSADGLPNEVVHLWWTRSTGVPWWRKVVAEGSGWRLDDVAVSDVPTLPTLPTHLQTHPPETHPPEVALLLALYDVPEIRARVETP